MQVLGGQKLEKNIKGGPKDNFWKICLYIKTSPLYNKNEVPIL
jgi:hypothetical protein